MSWNLKVVIDGQQFLVKDKIEIFQKQEGEDWKHVQGVRIASGNGDQLTFHDPESPEALAMVGEGVPASPQLPPGSPNLGSPVVDQESFRRNNPGAAGTPGAQPVTNAPGQPIVTAQSGPVSPTNPPVRVETVDNANPLNLPQGTPANPTASSNAVPGQQQSVGVVSHNSSGTQPATMTTPQPNPAATPTKHS